MTSLSLRFEVCGSMKFCCLQYLTGMLFTGSYWWFDDSGCCFDWLGQVFLIPSFFLWLSLLCFFEGVLSRLLTMIGCHKIFLVKEFSVKRSIITNLIVYKYLIGWTSLFWLFKHVSTVAQSTKSGSFSLSHWDTTCWIAASSKIWIFTLLNLLKDCRLIYSKYYCETLLLCIWVFSQVVVLILHKLICQRSCWIRLDLFQYWSAYRRIVCFVA